VKYLLIKGIAGLGNRILAAATGFLYAELAGRRALVDWGDPNYSDDGSDVFHRYFDNPSVGGRDELPATDSVTPEMWRGRLDRPARDLRVALGGTPRPVVFRRTCVDLMRSDHPEDVAVMWSNRERIEMLRPLFRGEHAHLARLPTNVILRRTIETHMRPREEINDRVERFRRERLPGRVVGVHARYSDRRTRLDLIRHRLERVLAKEGDLRVFLATDNIEVRDEFERCYGAVSPPHWYPAPGAASHQGGNRPDPPEAGAEALVDLQLLAGCDHLIGDRESSFSRVAMLMSDAPRSRISDVQAIRSRWHLPVKAVWRQVVPGPAAPLAVAVARRLAP
jgi:hypothetical protein